MGIFCGAYSADTRSKITEALAAAQFQAENISLLYEADIISNVGAASRW